MSVHISIAAGSCRVIKMVKVGHVLVTFSIMNLALRLMTRILSGIMMIPVSVMSASIAYWYGNLTQ
jgi:hypothetical protein